VRPDDRDIDDELRAHLELEIRERTERGEDERTARRAALDDLGYLPAVRDSVRRVWHGAWYDAAVTVAQDVRFGLRMLRRSPSSTVAALLTLAIGIGAGTAIFSVVHATLLEPLPFPEPDRLVMVWSTLRGGRSSTSHPDFRDWRSQSTAFRSLHAWTGRRISLSAGGRPEQVRAAVTTPGFLSMHGHRFLLGRDFVAEEGAVGRDQVVVLSHRLWERRFGGDRGLVGRSVRLDGRPHTVVGVLAAGAADRAPSEAYLPLAVTPEQDGRGQRFLTVMGRLQAGVSLAQANASLQTIARRSAAADPQAYQDRGVRVEPLQNNFVGRETIAGLWLALSAAGMVLLIACANVTSVLLARGAARRQEVALRASLGATRGRVFRQLLTESVLLAALGGAAGVALAAALVRVIGWSLPPNTLPSEADVRLDLPVLLFTLGASLVAGVLAGAAPAWQATRSDLVATLKQDARAGGARRSLRGALVVAEFALAIVLLAGGGLAVHTLYRLARVDLGFQREDVMTSFLPVPPDRLATAEQIDAFYRRLLDRVEAAPGVASASISTGMPVGGTQFGRRFHVSGRPFADPSERPSVALNMVTPEYFRTFGIPLLRGRALTDDDRAGRSRVAVVNETFARRYLEGAEPLGTRLVVDQVVPGASRPGPAVEWEVVGVVRDVRNRGPRQDVVAEVAVPFAQSPWAGATLAVRTSVAPEIVRPGLAAAVQSLDPDLPMTDVRTMDETVGDALAGDRFRAFLFGSFAAVGLVLAAVGIYGVVSFAVAQRTREIGLRMALGARRGQVLRLVLREGMRHALLGTALGVLGAFVLAQVLRTTSYRVSAIDPAALAVVVTLLLGAAAAACLLPARRAASIDPMTALRHD
jgi:putative ABC transport system permease protein